LLIRGCIDDSIVGWCICFVDEYAVVFLDGEEVFDTFRINDVISGKDKEWFLWCVVFCLKKSVSCSELFVLGVVGKLCFFVVGKTIKDCFFFVADDNADISDVICSKTVKDMVKYWFSCNRQHHFWFGVGEWLESGAFSCG